MALNYKYMILNMRDKSAALEALKATPEVWGIEVTDPTLAGGCKTSIDPQHGMVNQTLYFGHLHYVGVGVNENGDPTFESCPECGAKVDCLCGHRQKPAQRTPAAI